MQFRCKYPKNSTLVVLNLREQFGGQGFVAYEHQEDKGFVPYIWLKPGTEESMEKISYLMGFEPRGWVIDLSIYLDSLKQGTHKRLQFESAVFLLVSLNCLRIESPLQTNPSKTDQEAAHTSR